MSDGGAQNLIIIPEMSPAPEGICALLHDAALCQCPRIGNVHLRGAVVAFGMPTGRF